SVFLEFPIEEMLQGDKDVRAMLLRAILTDRLRVRVREELGAAYAPMAAIQSTNSIANARQLVVIVEVAPGREQQVLETCLAICDDLGSKGIGTDELTRAREPLLTELAQQERKNG